MRSAFKKIARLQHVAIFTALIVFGLLLAGPNVAPAHASGARDYVVEPGDTLIGIAARHGVSVSQLARINGLRTNSWVYVGQRVVIPGQADGPAPRSGRWPASERRAWCSRTSR